MMDSDYEPFTDKLSVEVSVRFGDNHGVMLTTTVGIENFLAEPVKTRARLNQIISVLTKSLPIEELRGMEREYYDKREVAMGSDGQMVLTPAGLAKTVKEQNELKKRIKTPEIKPEGNNPEAPPERLVQPDQP